MAQEISLRVFGGSLSAGFNRTPLLTVGAVPDSYVPMPPTIVDEQKAWMIAHTQSHTVYSLYTRECKTADGSDGQLLISIFFPASRRLAAGASPLSLLNTLLDVVSIQLLSDGMLPKEAADPTAFIALLKRYPLEDRSLALPVMAGSSPAAFCAANTSQLDALMRHSRHPALAKVGLLEIGLHCRTTINIPVGSKPSPVQPQPAAMPKQPQPVEQPAQPRPAAQPKLASPVPPRPATKPPLQLSDSNTGFLAKTWRQVKIVGYVLLAAVFGVVISLLVFLVSNGIAVKFVPLDYLRLAIGILSILILVGLFLLSKQFIEKMEQRQVRHINAIRDFPLVLMAAIITFSLPIMSMYDVNHFVAKLTGQWYLSSTTRVFIVIATAVVAYALAYFAFLRFTSLKKSYALHAVSMTLTFLWSMAMGLANIPD